jgi:putative GTP pyrophosphokinase
MTQKTPEEWGAEYAASRSNYESYALRLKSLLSDLLDGEGIDYVQIEARAKTVVSFVEKIKRKGQTDKNPISSVTDLVGLRVITYYVEDVQKVGELLEREFILDKDNSVDKAKVLAFDQFGYRSSHFVAKLGSRRNSLSEWAPFKDFVVEFQVRTALQHAWAAVSHKLDYKSPDDAPETLRRRLFRLSALFELADEQFSILRDESTETVGRYRLEVGKGKLDIPVDTSSIDVYLNLSGRMAELSRLFESHKWNLSSPTDSVDDERLRRDRSDLVKALKDYGMGSLSDLDAYLSDRDGLEKILNKMNDLLESTDEDDAVVSVYDVLTQIIIVDKDETDNPGFPPYTAESAAQMKKVRDALRIVSG